MGWAPGLWPLVATLPVLLVVSAFFSGSETAYFGLGQAQRRRLGADDPGRARVVDGLLARPRELLVTLMIGNMAANVTYFVITSVLALRAPGAAEAAGVSAASLAAIVLLGEVVPKLVATSGRERWCARTAVPVKLIHGALTPLRAPVVGLIGPLSRLAPAPREEPVTHEELAALLTRSVDAGAIDHGEAQLLARVAELSALRARDVMTPRVRVRWLRAGADRAALLEALRERPVAQLLVCEDEPDHGVVGVLDTAPALAARGPRAGASVTTRVRPPVFVPESAPLDKVLEMLGAAKQGLAVVVDEFGGVVGVVTAGDIVSRLVGESPGTEDALDADRPVVEDLGGGVFRVPGRLAVRDWGRLLGPGHRARTVGGLVMERLGRTPAVGDTVRLGSVTIRVESLDGLAVGSALVSAGGGVAS